MSGRKRNKKSVLIVIFAVLVAMSVYMDWNMRTKAFTLEDVMAQQAEMVGNRCFVSPSFDLDLLRVRSWYHDPEHRVPALLFEEHAFVYNRGDGNSSSNQEGAYCADDASLQIMYYKREFVPARIHWSKLALEFGTRLRPLSEDQWEVRLLAPDKLVLYFKGDGKEHVFYRPAE